MINDTQQTTPTQITVPSSNRQGDTQDPMVEESVEEKELNEIKKTFLDAPKFTKWRELYFDKDNTLGHKTWQNKQLSALIAYNLDPTNSKDREYASTLGYRNARKCQNWAREFIEASGMTQHRRRNDPARPQRLEFLEDRATARRHRV